MIINLLKIL